MLYFTEGESKKKQRFAMDVDDDNFCRTIDHPVTLFKLLSVSNDIVLFLDLILPRSSTN